MNCSIYSLLFSNNSLHIYGRSRESEPCVILYIFEVNTVLINNLISLLSSNVGSKIKIYFFFLYGKNPN